MEQLIKVAEGYELTPSKAGIETMVNDMMLKVDIVLGRVDGEDHPEIGDVELPEGFSVYNVANLAAQVAMMEYFAKIFKKEIAGRMPAVMKQFEGDPAMSKNGNSLIWQGVTFTKKSGSLVYDFTSNETWQRKNRKVAELEMKLQDAKTDLKAVEEKMKRSGEGYVTDKNPDSVSMSIGK